MKAPLRGRAALDRPGLVPGPRGDALVIRPRRDTDLEGCLAMAAAVHDLDGYPPRHPGGDFRRFLVGDGALTAWVAESGAALAGHVALHRQSSDPVMELACAELHLAPERLGVVARLFVDPAQRRSGVGRALLDAAAGEARRRNLYPILDVGVALTRAVALYDSAGWSRLGQVTVKFRDGVVFEEYVYAAPTEPATP